MHRFVVAIALLSGCGKGDKGPPDKAEKPADKPADKPAARPAADLFTGPAVALPEAAAKLAPEMPEAQARSAAPEIFAAKFGYAIPGFDGATLFAQVEGDRLYSIRLEIKQPLESVKGWLAKKWGEPRAFQSAFVWNAPATGLRAKIEGSAASTSVYYSKIMGLDALLGKGKLFGFEKVPLIGAKQADAMTALAEFRPKAREQDPGSIALSLPPIEAADYGSNVDVRVKNGVVTGFTFQFGHGDDAAAKAAFARRLEELYGKGKPGDLEIYTQYPGPPAAKSELRNDKGFPDVVWVGDTAP